MCPNYRNVPVYRYNTVMPKCMHVWFKSQSHGDALSHGLPKWDAATHLPGSACMHHHVTECHTGIIALADMDQLTSEGLHLLRLLLLWLCWACTTYWTGFDVVALCGIPASGFIADPSAMPRGPRDLLPLLR